MVTRVEKTITVDVPVSTAYNQWTQFEDFPEFMGGVQKVEQLEDMRLHWVAEIAGVKREWYATILEQRPDEKVAWAATEGATNAGAVYFAPSGTGTLVRLELEFEPEGLVEKAGDAMNIVERQAESDLEKFKSFIESRRSETGAWRGEVEGQTFGTPGVESATSQGDSGKAGVSGKAAAAGVAAAAAAGVAAAAAARKSGDTETETTETAETTETTEVPGVPTFTVENTGTTDETVPPVTGAMTTDAPTGGAPLAESSVADAPGSGGAPLAESSVADAPGSGSADTGIGEGLATGASDTGLPADDTAAGDVDDPDRRL